MGERGQRGLGLSSCCHQDPYRPALNTPDRTRQGMALESHLLGRTQTEHPCLGPAEGSS